MNAPGLLAITTVAACAAVCWTAVQANAADPAATPSLQGSYILDHRELPDGHQLRPPQVIGMLTFTKDRRNFNVYWTDNGKPVSLSIISKYSLSPTEYTEENLFYFDHGVSGNQPTYETTPARGTAPVTVRDGRIEFKFPLHNEPAVVFDKNGMTATRPGAFVDHWKKVE
jgi:hypothetical protein